jgi:hypothetical protein
MVVPMQTTVAWHVMQCHLADMYRWFERIGRCHHKDSRFLRNSSTSNRLHGITSHKTVINAKNYHISWPVRCTFFPEKCDLNSTRVLCAEGKCYFQTCKYLYVYYTTSLLWDSEICFQIMRSGITACERLTFLSRDLPWRIHCITCDSRYLCCCSSQV